jgi:LmbE family N-acetylglucosaminyl deacetylase
LLIFFAAIAFADGPPGEAAAVAIVLDLSYSMTIRDPGAPASRVGLATESIRELIAGAGEEVFDWALLTADDHSKASVAVPFGEPAGDLLAAMESLLPWGTTSISTMVSAGREYLAATEHSEKYLILVSDCINTHGELYQLPDLGELAEDGIVPAVVGFPSPEFPALFTAAEEWIERAGGLIFEYSEVDRLRRFIGDADFDREGYGSGKDETVGREQVQYDALDVPNDDTRYFPIWWIFVVVVAGLLVYLLPIARRWFAARRAAAVIPKETTTDIRLSVGIHGEPPKEYSFDDFPIKIAGAGKADLVLEHPRISSGGRVFELDEDANGVFFRSRGSLIVNGVGRRSVRLNAGDRIAFGRYRLVFGGVSRTADLPESVPPPRMLYLSLLLPVLVALAMVFRHPLAIHRSGPTSAAAGDVLMVPHEATVVAPKQRQDVPAASGNLESDGTATDRALAAPGEVASFPTQMWPPGKTPDFIELDVLFIHAHPDDESLDFGVLLSRLSAAGKKTATVLMTDGESGLDQFPERSVDAMYPAYDLRGDALADVRYREARSALSVLGVRHYVRLGLQNHGYNGELDVLNPDAVFEAWGGEASLVRQLSEIINGYRPEVIVSPEGPSTAFEHFEHEATGLIVAKALLDAAWKPSGVLVSVDPLQKALFDDVIGIRADLEDQGSGLTFRAVQAAALAKHRTQRDATVVGIENLSNFDREYYRIVWWDLEMPVEEYLYGG